MIKPATPRDDSEHMRYYPTSAIYDYWEVKRRWKAYPRLVDALRKLLDAYEKRDGAVSPIAKAILHFVPAGKRKHFQDAITELRALLRELGE